MPPPHLLDALRDTVLLCDGAVGTRVLGMPLDVERDFLGKENCTDVLNLSRPDVVRDIHRGYFEAGADMVETNTFGGSPVTLAEFDIADRAYEINKLGGERRQNRTRRSRQRHPDLRSGDGGDHRHAAGRSRHRHRRCHSARAGRLAARLR